jgi:hypothetical protein
MTDASSDAVGAARDEQVMVILQSIVALNNAFCTAGPFACGLAG